MYSYDQQDSACGETVSSLMGLATQLNGAFDERAWQDAKQRGSLVCPGKKDYPQWPAPSMMPALDDSCGKNADLGRVTGDKEGHPNGEPVADPNRAFQAPYSDEVPRECRNKRVPPAPTGDPQTDAEARFAGAPEPLPLLTTAEIGAILDGRSAIAERSNPTVAVMPQEKVEGDEEEDEDERKCWMTEKCRNMGKAVKGCCYDLKHWKQLPGGKDCMKKLCYAVSRDGRLPYIVTAVTLATIFIVAFMMILFGVCKKDKKELSQQ